MKKILLPLAVLIAGVGVGGGAAFGTGLLVGPRAPASAAAKEGPTGFVPATKITVPLVTADGRLSGYNSFDVALQVPLNETDTVGQRLPLFLHAVNMRTYRTPMAAGPDGLLPDLGTFRALCMDAAREAFGPHVVRLVAVTRAVPA